MMSGDHGSLTASTTKPFTFSATLQRRVVKASWCTAPERISQATSCFTKPALKTHLSDVCPLTGTPFIPDSALYPSSPYSNPGSSHPSPNRAAIPLPATAPTDRFTFPTYGLEPDYPTPWGYNRERRPSWHASNPGSLHPSPNRSAIPLPATAPTDRFTFPTYGLEPDYPTSWGYNRERRPSWHASQDGAWLQVPNGVGRNRRHSFGASARPPLFQGGVLYINPWINAESPRNDFYFDLAPPSFNPQRLYGTGQSTLLPSEDMIQPATHPPISRLRIICDAIPQWPCELQLDPYQTGGYQPPPISLSDVLVAVHRNMHRPIGDADWLRLGEQGKIAVANAFSRRCRATSTTFDHERSKGVKRVDYLLGRTQMRGLVRATSSEGWEVMKLIVE
ncbi:hypothetical protein LshimejAT787_1105490 [Lyophyllum shimeji]|uniref:DUF6699 domain-containing protein n=1 Tax=Lyophyllum shimeji TaxID=47721 RepID=A0A9P3UPA6_LYOSH|nr:hypothetical protein LshimejAT787_1105490 [Lyophyllum shimeji]